MQWTIFCCTTKTFYPETLKFLWDGFYWNPCWNWCEYRDGRVSERKWEPCYWDINYQSRVIPEQRWELSVSLKLWRNGSGSECFHSELIYTVASIYHENNKVNNFLAQDFRLGCPFELPRICVVENTYGGIHFLKRLQASILQLYWGLSLCVSFSRVLLELSEDLKAVE